MNIWTELLFNERPFIYGLENIQIMTHKKKLKAKKLRLFNAFPELLIYFFFFSENQNIWRKVC